MNRYVLLFFCALACMLVSSQDVTAIGVGISPGRAEFDTVLRGGYAERTIKISTGADAPIAGELRVSGEVAPWISFRPNTSEFIISADQSHDLTIVVEPDLATPTGNYSGLVEVITDAGVFGGGRAGGVVKTAIVMTLDVEVSGDEFIDCRAGGFRLNDIEEGFPLDVSFNVINDGNVRLSPTLNVQVFDQLQENIVHTDRLTASQVLPTTQANLFVQAQHELEQGQYWATLRVEECNVEQLLTFSVVEKGGIIDTGELTRIFAPPSLELGQTAEVLAQFVNTGPRAVDAYFEGVVRRDDVLITQLKSQEVVVPSNQEVELRTFFTPYDPGRYVISGRVVYNKKLTFEKSAVMTAYTPEVQEESTWLTLLIFIILVVTIFFLIRKISKEKKQKMHGHHFR